MQWCPTSTGTTNTMATIDNHGTVAVPSATRVTTHTGSSPVGMAITPPVAARTVAVVAERRRSVDGDAPTAISVLRSSRLSTAASDNPIATTSSTSSRVAATMAACTSVDDGFQFTHW